MKRIDSAEEISAVVQPNSFCRGTMKTPGARTLPAEIRAGREGTPPLAQTEWMVRADAGRCAPSRRRTGCCGGRGRLTASSRSLNLRGLRCEDLPGLAYIF